MTNEQLERENAELRARLQVAQAKLEGRRVRKAPVVRTQAIECMRAMKDAPNRSVVVGILAKYFAPKKKGETQEAWEGRVAALVSEMNQ